MESKIQNFPLFSTLSSSVVSFLNERLHNQEDLATAPTLVSELQSQCLDLDQALLDLNSRLESSLLAYASFSDRIHGLFSDASSKLTDLGSLTRAPTSLSGPVASVYLQIDNMYMQDHYTCFALKIFFNACFKC